MVSRWNCRKIVKTTQFITVLLSKIMATLRTVIVPTKALKGGRHKVRISVAHNGQTRYIPTSVIIDSAREFKNGIVVNRGDASFLNTKLRTTVQKLQNAIDELEYVDGLSCSELVYLLTNTDMDRHKTIAEVFGKYIEMANIAKGTRDTYTDHYQCLSRYVGADLRLERINHMTVVGFHKFMLDKGYSSNTRRDRLVFLNQLINFAKRCGYAIPPMDPFSGFNLPSQEVRQSWLTVDDVRRIRDAECKRRNVMICRDCFMLSYYLGGINIVDLLSVNFDECSYRIKYERTKTKNKPKMNKYVEFVIPDEAKPIIAKYKGRDGRLFFGEYNNRSRLHCVFDYYMRQLAEIAGIKHLIYYAARKSFAQHAFQLGVSESVVDYILGHRVDKVSTALYSYISVTPKQASDAVRMVLDNLR